MAEQEISYGDAFGSPATVQPAAPANTNAPPEVPMAGGTPSEIAYNDAFPQPKESVLHQAVTAFSPGGALDTHDAVGRIAHAFGESVQQSAEDIESNFSKDGGDLVKSLKESGMWQPYVQDQNNFNKSFLFKTAVPAIQDLINSGSELGVRALATAANVGMAIPNIISGTANQAIEELPLSDELKEYAESGAIFGDFPHFEMPPKLPLSEGVAKGVVGTTEGQNAGVEPLTEDQHTKQAVAEAQMRPVEPAAREPETTPVPVQEDNIHGYARTLDPETFSKYDKLAETRDDLRKQLSDLNDAASDKVLTPEERDNRYELQQQLQETNAGMRDLAPKVSDAYLQAQQFEKNPESVPADTMGHEVPQEMKDELASRVSPITEDITQKLMAVGRSADDAKASAEVATRMYQYMADVYGGEKGTAQDWYEREAPEIKGVKEKAKSLAQPKNKGKNLNQFSSDEDEAYAKKQGELSNLDGKIATETDPDKLQDLKRERDLTSKWMDENPRQLNQTTKGMIYLATHDSNAVISLMKRADASTFLHESSHHFLDMMDRYSKENDAPEKLKSDMATIRKWTGLSEKEYETRKEREAFVKAHEKFARGFERYLMEGVAPNRDMALVFAKFKKWLTSIYKTYSRIPQQGGGINEDVRSFFDHVLSRTPERTVIASDVGLKENIKNPKLGDLFGNVPKAPETLTEWLSNKGGIKDDGTGDLQAMDADKAHLDPKTGRARPFVKKLVKDTGMDLDEAARAAHEAGYFPEKGDQRPSIQEFKEKILEDLTGNKQYSDKEHEGLGNHEEALKYNAQVDQISHETGISSEGKTHDQFFDEVAKYYDEEKRYNEAQDMASDARDAFEEYERKQREFIESRGDAWEPEEEPASPTLEEMENERKQAIASEDALSGTANSSEPERAAGASESGEAGVQQSGSSVESDGRAGQGGTSQDTTAANELAARQQLDAARQSIADAPIGDTVAPEPSTKPGAAPDPNTPADKSEFIDKAGNVRLDLLTDSDSVKAAMREAAAKNPQIFNHGVVTDAQVAEFADAMGADARAVNIQKLRAISVEDDIPLAARIRSGSQMMVDALNHSLELMNKENPTDDDVAKFLEAKNQFLMIAETVSATTNEMGRGFRAYNNLMKEYNVTDIHEAAELFQRMTGRTLDDVKKEMKAGKLLKTPQQIAKFTQDSLKPNFMDKLIEYRNNSLLSGPVTHTFYTAGGFFNSAYKPLQTLAGLAVQSIREGLGGEINERIYAHEALAQFNALGYGSMRGLKAAMESWKSNAELALPKEITSAPLLKVLDNTGLENVEGAKDLGWLPKKQANEGKLGSVINAPSRLVGSIHSFQKMLNYQQNLASLATREALEKGFDPKGDVFGKFVSDRIDNPSATMMDKAGESALKEVYREKVDYNSFSGQLFNLMNKSPVTKVLFPFIKMQYNIKRIAFRDNSVLGFLDPSVRADVAGINGDVAKNMAIGKIAAGTAVAGLGISMTAQGLNNGGGPSDPKAYKTWRLTHTPYSVQVGSIVIPHKALGLWGQLLGWSGDMAEGAHEFDPADIEKSAWHFVRKAGAIFTEEGFMTQAKNTLDAAFTPEQFGTRFIQNFATQWLPFSVGFSQTNRLLNDDMARRVKSEGAKNLWGVPEAMAYKYPGTSELLEPQRDMFGQPIQTGVVSSPGYEKYANDPVVQKLESLQTGIGRLSDKIKRVQLTEEQYDDYGRIAGQMTYARLSKLVAMPGFDKMPPQHQLQMIEKTTTSMRLQAANQIMKMNPEIMQQATAKKRLSIYGNKAVNEAEEDQTEDVNNP